MNKVPGHVPFRYLIGSREYSDSVCLPTISDIAHLPLTKTCTHLYTHNSCYLFILLHSIPVSVSLCIDHSIVFYGKWAKCVLLKKFSWLISIHNKYVYCLNNWNKQIDHNQMFPPVNTPKGKPDPILSNLLPFIRLNCRDGAPEKVWESLPSVLAESRSLLRKVQLGLHKTILSTHSHWWVIQSSVKGAGHSSVVLTVCKTVKAG